MLLSIPRLHPRTHVPPCEFFKQEFALSSISPSMLGPIKRLKHHAAQYDVHLNPVFPPPGLPPPVPLIFSSFSLNAIAALALLDPPIFGPLGPSFTPPLGGAGFRAFRVLSSDSRNSRRNCSAMAVSASIGVEVVGVPRVFVELGLGFSAKYSSFDSLSTASTIWSRRMSSLFRRFCHRRGLRLGLVAGSSTAGSAGSPSMRRRACSVSWMLRAVASGPRSISCNLPMPAAMRASGAGLFVTAPAKDAEIGASLAAVFGVVELVRERCRTAWARCAGMGQPYLT